MFKVGDLAVYPAHGVGVIEAIKSMEVSGTKRTFYVIRTMGSGATIMVPVDNAETVGLRRLVDKSVVPKVYEILKDRKEVFVDHQTWNRKYREYMERIKTGCVLEVAKVLKELYLIKCDKELSFGERKIMDTARCLLVKELSIVRKITEEKIEEEINRIMQS